MAKLLCQADWDPKAGKVVTKYTVLQVQPQDQIQIFTTDSKPFIIETKDERVVKRLRLQKAQNADGRDDLYKVQEGAPPGAHFVDHGKAVNCGTLDEQEHFVPWGPGIPLDGD